MTTLRLQIIRPENIRIQAGEKYESEESRSLIPASILSTTYLGEIRQYTCSITGNEDVLWKISILGDSIKKFSPKERVILSISPANIALLER